MAGLFLNLAALMELSRWRDAFLAAVWAISRKTPSLKNFGRVDALLIVVIDQKLGVLQNSKAGRETFVNYLAADAIFLWAVSRQCFVQTIVFGIGKKTRTRSPVNQFSFTNFKESSMNMLTVGSRQTTILDSGRSLSQIRESIVGRLVNIGDNLHSLACDWVEYVNKDGNIAEFRHATGYTEWFPLIYFGQLTAEAVLKFAHDPAKLRLLVNMPADKQKSLANGQAVAYFNEDKGIEENRPLITIPNKFIGRVISSDGEIVPVDQQRSMAAKKPPKKTPAKTPKCPVVFDRQGNGKSTSRAFHISAVMFAAKAVSAFKGLLEQAKGRPAHPHIVVHFCEHDKQLVESVAEAAGCSPEEWIRSACGAYAVCK